MNPRLLKRCQLLSVEIGVWVYWANTSTRSDLLNKTYGPRFAPIAQWLAVVEEKRKLVAPPIT